MKASDPIYAKFGLVRDMLETPDLVAGFDVTRTREVAAEIAKLGKLLLSGEGSSRIFPAKHAIAQARRAGSTLTLHTESSRQAQEYNLAGWAVFAASNSGKTSEIIKLMQDLRAKGRKHLYGLTATPGSKLAEVTDRTFVLTCGKEGAVAATKSVLEQALFYHSLIEHISGTTTMQQHLSACAGACREALTTRIDRELVSKIAKAPTIFFAGRNDGVAEELTLKTNEITRKKADFLEGTYAAHGVEEIMDKDDVLIWIDPYDDAIQKFQDILVKGVGLTVIAIASRPTPFPTIRVPASELSAYVSMCAGWNLLVEVGLSLGIDLDKPQRARKVGFEFTG